jgi:hypothetical protein
LNINLKELEKIEDNKIDEFVKEIEEVKDFDIYLENWKSEN